MYLRALGIAVPLLFALPGHAQSANEIQTAILQELRQLRASIERTSTLSARTQLVVHRLALTERRVTQLTAQLEGVRKEILAAQADRVHASNLMVRAETERNLAETPTLRKSILAADVESYKRRADAQADREAQAKIVEIQVSNDLRLERSRLSEDVSRLEEIERALASIASPGPQ